MQVNLHLEYPTQWGQQLYVCFGAHPEEGRTLPDDALAMNNDGKGHWFINVDYNRFLTHPAYHYCVAYRRDILTVEYGESGHHLDGPFTKVWDVFRTHPIDRAYFSRLFTDVIYHHDIEEYKPATMFQHPTLTVEVEASRIRPGHFVALTGDTPRLGQWDPARSLPMHYRLDADGRPVWSATVPLDGFEFPLLYKFVVIDQETGQLVSWENRPDRYFEPGTLRAGEHLVIRDRYFVSSQHPWRGAGVSIHSEELSTELIDWAVASGLNVIDIVDADEQHTLPYALREYAAQQGVWFSGPVSAGLDILRLDPIQKYFDRLDDPFYNHNFEDLWVNLGRKRLSSIIDGHHHQLYCASIDENTPDVILKTIEDLHIPRTEDLFALYPLSFFFK